MILNKIYNYNKTLANNDVTRTIKFENILNSIIKRGRTEQGQNRSWEKNKIIYGKPIYVVRAQDIKIKLFYYLRSKKINYHRLPSKHKISYTEAGLGQKSLIPSKGQTYQNTLMTKTSIDTLTMFNLISTIRERVNLYNFSKDLRHSYNKRFPILNLPSRLVNIKRFTTSDTAITSSFNYISIKLQLVRLYYPYFERTILSQYVSESTKNKSFSRIFTKIAGNLPRVTVKNNALSPFYSIQAFAGDRVSDRVNEKQAYAIIPCDVLPSYFSGVKIQLSGRLVTQFSIPRKTIYSNYVGEYATRSNSNKLTSQRLFTSKNRKGSYTIKTWLSQRTMKS